MLIRSGLILLMLCAASFGVRAQPTTTPAADPAVVRLHNELDLEQRKARDTSLRIDALTQRLRETGRSEVSAEALHRGAEKLDDQILDLQLEDAASKARIDAMLQEIDTQMMKIDHAVNEDSVRQELQKLVDLDLKKYQTLAQTQDKTPDAGAPGIIHRGDRLQIMIDELTPGQEIVKACEVKEDGKISLPYVGAVTAAGVNEAALETAIQKAFTDAGIAKGVQISVTVAKRATEALNATATELAEAKARLAVQRDHIINTAGGDVVAALRKQLVELTIAQKERDARLKLAREQRDAITDGLSKADEVQTLQTDLKYLRSRIHELEEKLDSLQ